MAFHKKKWKQLKPKAARQRMAKSNMNRSKSYLMIYQNKIDKTHYMISAAAWAKLLSKHIWMYQHSKKRSAGNYHHNVITMLCTSNQKWKNGTCSIQREKSHSIWVIS